MSAHASARPIATASSPRQDAAPPPATRPRGAWRPGRDTLLALGAMLIAGLGMTLVQYAVLRDRLADELRTQATILAQTAQAAMLFGDAAESHELLGPLRAHRAIRSARLLDPAGRALARLDPPDAEARWDEGLPSVPPADVPIVANGRTIGTVQLAARMAPLWRELATFAAATAAVMAAALCLAAWGSRGLRADVRAAEQRQRYLAAHDALTGLANRATFNALLARATEPGTDAAEFALVFIDVDDFKRVNDTYGHGAGDALLQAVARRLRGHAGASDLVARLGGDEFAMVLRESPSPGAVRQLAGRILADLAEPIDYQGDRISASASIGIALYPRDADGTAALLQAADTAMYHAKRLGKNSCEFYTTQIASGRAAQRALEEDLRIAIDGPELWLAYQPVYDSGDRIVSFEALLRWTHPRRGLVAPGDFVMLAEAAGLMPSLGLAILRIAARDIAAWRGHGLVVPRIAINLSSRQFPRDRHRAAFVEALDRHRLGPRDVSFELTESAVFEDMQSPQSVIAGLQARGYALALDDFGTGYSSLAYLLKLRCQSLKLDRAFVDGVSGSKESALLVSAIVQLAHGLGMQVIAEGVEQPADLAQVRRLGCDGVQGYLLARPMPAGAAARLLRPALERTPVA